MVNDTALQLEGAPSWLHKRTSTFNSGVSEETESLTGEYSDAGELDSPDECTRQSPSQPQQALKTAACSQNDLLIIGGSASALSCIINLTNTVAGTGMLGLPGAFAGSGFVVGTILLIVASLFSANGLRLLALSAEKVGISQEKPSSFYIIANAALPDFTLVIDFAVALKCFGVATGYFITVGDCMVDAFRYILTNMSAEMDGIERILEARQFWVLWGLAFVLPISFYRTLDSLKFTSTLSLIIIYALALGVVLYGHGLFNPCEGITASTNIEILLSETTTEEFVLEDEDLDLYYDNGPFLRRWLQRVLVEPLEIASQDAAEMFLEDNAPECRGDVEAWTDPIGTLKNLAIFVFSFTCHQNVFSVVNEIKNRTQLRVNMVITAAIGSALLLYLIVATEGYRTYGSNVMGNILLNYPQTALVTIMRISISVMVILSYPLQLDPARRCITSFVHALKQRSETRDVEGTASFTKLNTNDPDELGGIEKGGITVELSAMKLDTKKTAEGSLEAKGCIHEKTDKVVRKDSDTFLFNCITCTFIALSFLISLVVTDLGTILAVVGATGSTMVSYILPGGIYIKLHPKFTITKALAYLQLIVGCIIIPTALYFVVFFGTVE